MADIRVSATVRKPVKEAIKRMQKREDRSESQMVSVLLEEALAARESKAKAA